MLVLVTNEIWGGGGDGGVVSSETEVLRELGP